MPSKRAFDVPLSLVMMITVKLLEGRAEEFEFSRMTFPLLVMRRRVIAWFAANIADKSDRSESLHNRLCGF
jgi:hypothetical protein